MRQGGAQLGEKQGGTRPWRHPPPVAQAPTIGEGAVHHSTNNLSAERAGQAGGRVNGVPKGASSGCGWAATSRRRQNGSRRRCAPTQRFQTPS